MCRPPVLKYDSPYRLPVEGALQNRQLPILPTDIAGRPE